MKTMRSVTGQAEGTVISSRFDIETVLQISLFFSTTPSFTWAP